MKLLSKIFLSNRIILSTIVSNSIIITWMGFPAYRNHPNPTYHLHGLVEGIDQFFIWFFFIEMLVKIHLLSLREYLRSNWNKFDAFLVLISFPSTLLYIFPSVFTFVPQTSLLLVFRMFRLMRMFRFFKFIPNMDHLIKGVGRATKASVFVFLALIFMNFIFGLFTCHLFGNMAPERFGDPFVSMYSIFQMFTVEGWYEMPQALEGKVGGWMTEGLVKLYFIAIVLVGGIMGMSLVNAIFVDEMTMDNNDDLEAKMDKLQEELESIRGLLENRGKR